MNKKDLYRFTLGFVLVLLLNSGCNFSPSEDNPADQIAIELFGSRDALDRKLAGIETDFEETTTQTDPYIPSTIDQISNIEFEKRLPLAGLLTDENQLKSQRVSPIIPPFSEKPYLQSSTVPFAVAITNDGDLFIASEEGLVVYESTTKEPSSIIEDPVKHLQINAKGDKVLAQSENRIYIVETKSHDFERVAEKAEGQAYWHPQEDQLLIVGEEIQFDASVKKRIRLTTQIYDLKKQTIKETDWISGGRYASLGTLPTLDTIWGHLPEDYTIDPVPAPIYRLFEGTPAGKLTDDNGTADLAPVADQNGNIYFLRTYRRGSGSTRAWVKLSDTGEELQLTLRKTHHVAASPDGKWLVIVEDSNDQQASVYRTPGSEVLTQLEKWRERKRLEAVEVAKAKFIERQIAEELADLPSGKTLYEDSGLLWLKEVPTEEEILLLSQKFEAVLQDTIGLEPLKTYEDLEAIEMYINRFDGLWSEHPALVIAIGGLIVNLTDGDATYIHETLTPVLSIDVDSPLESDQLSWTLVQPFGLARERISQGYSLVKTLSHARKAALPIYLVGDFTEEIRLEVDRRELQKRKIDRAVLSNPRQYFELLRNNQQFRTGTTLRYGYLIGEESSDERLMLYASVLLAEKTPWSEEALQMLIDSLLEASYSKDASQIQEKLVLLKPEDAFNWLALGDSYAILNELEKARKAYNQARLVDIAQIWEADLQARFQMLENIKAESSAE